MKYVNCPDRLAEGMMSFLLIGYSVLLLADPSIFSSPPYAGAFDHVSPFAASFLFGSFGLLQGVALLGQCCWLRKIVCGGLVGVWGGIAWWYYTHHVHPLGAWTSLVVCGMMTVSFLRLWSHVHSHTQEGAARYGVSATSSG